MPLNKIAEEIQIQESDALRLAVYAGLRRERGGFYDDGQFLRVYVKHLHERLFGCAPLDVSADDPPKKSRPRRVRVVTRQKAVVGLSTSSLTRSHDILLPGDVTE